MGGGMDALKNLGTRAAVESGASNSTGASARGNEYTIDMEYISISFGISFGN